MNNWQHSFSTPLNLVEHLQKPYFRYDSKEKEVNKVVFDSSANLIWAGDSYSRISSYLPDGRLYTRHTANVAGSPTRDLLGHPNGILSLTDDSVHFSTKRGLTRLNLTSIDSSLLVGLQAMCYGSYTQVYCAGNNPTTGILLIDLAKGVLSDPIDYMPKVKLMCSNNKLISIATQAGTVDLFDPLSNTVIKSLAAHNASITSMDSRDYTLVTAGRSEKFNNSFADPFVNIYDLRSMRQLPPVSFSKGTRMGTGGADFVKLHPVLPTVVTVASENGSFDFIDLSDPTLRTQYVHPCQSIKDFVISPNGDHLVFLENDNNLSKWNRPGGNANFSNTPEVLEYPDFVDDGALESPIPFQNYNYPLSSVGLPYYNEKLLSAWSQTVFRSSGTIPMTVGMPLSSEVAGNNSKLKINKIKPSLSESQVVSKAFPLQPYNRSKYGPRNTAMEYVCLKDQRNQVSSNIIPDDILRYKPNRANEIPPAYCRLQLTHGKYGSQNFDFKAFNKTRFSGLDTGFDCSYINAALQLYRFVPELFNFVVGCLKDEVVASDSLLTETGFVFDMLQRSRGKVCQCTNLQSTLSAVKNKVKELSIDKLAISEEPLEKSEVQEFNSFFLQQLIMEEKKNSKGSMILQELFGIKIEVTATSSCAHQTNQYMVNVPALQVASPGKNGAKCVLNRKSSAGINTSVFNILPYIESSMKKSRREEKMCNKCQKKRSIQYDNITKNLPSVLSLELNLAGNEWNIVRTTENWLSKEFYATMVKGRAVFKNTLHDLKSISSHQIFKYDLNGYIARIDDRSQNEGGARYVTYAKYYDPKQRRFQWYMFNDYLVIEIDEEEALNVSYWWKTPEIIIYCDSEELCKPFFSVDTYSIDYNILFRDHFARSIREGLLREYRTLSKTQETPRRGTLVAIDAEFVVLDEEQCEIDCSGVKTIIQPKKTALARVSVIRGEHAMVDSQDLYGTAFIDDYIVVNTNEIQDYLTRYSGILPGDLDPSVSEKPLVARNVAYRKIWLLMQLGCVFVGHGLHNDFKQININVPSEQIRDTALYFLQGKRFLSLRYLAYALLDRNIQQGNHDSIEDAYTALVLYKKYLSLKESGTLQHVLDTIYKEGRASNYRVPDEL